MCAMLPCAPARILSTQSHSSLSPSPPTCTTSSSAAPPCPTPHLSRRRAHVPPPSHHCPHTTGKLDLHVEFTGILNDKLCGFYRSNYTRKDGTTAYAATTQFEATDARRAFPCWDEPSCKATFDVTLTVPSKLVALSNMPVTSETILEGGDEEKKVVTYARTPIMSTYLLAFVIGEFERVQGAVAGVDVSVYTLPGQTEQGEFALDATLRSLPFCTSFARRGGLVCLVWTC